MGQPDVSGASVKIYTQSMNPTLYRRAMSFLSTLPYEKVRNVGRTPQQHVLEVVTEPDADIVVNIDEDAYCTRPESIEDLIRIVRDEGYALAGMPDGGVISHRTLHHPVSVNPYFMVLNTALIKTKYRPGIEADVDVTSDEVRKLIPHHLMHDEYAVVNGEPFTQLLVWVALNFPVLYLDARNHPDGTTTVLLDREGRPFLLHTWFSRMYGKWLGHTRRINARIMEARTTNPAGRAPGVLTRGAWDARVIAYKVWCRVQGLLAPLTRGCASATLSTLESGTRQPPERQPDVRPEDSANREG